MPGIEFSVDSFVLFFSLRTLNTSSHFLLASKVSTEKFTYNLIEDPLYVTSHLSLAAFKILSLSFYSLIIKCLGMGVLVLGSLLFSLGVGICTHLGFWDFKLLLFVDSCISSDLDGFDHYFFKQSLPLSFSSGAPICTYWYVISPLGCLFFIISFLFCSPNKVISNVPP